MNVGYVLCMVNVYVNVSLMASSSLA